MMSTDVPSNALAAPASSNAGGSRAAAAPAASPTASATAAAIAPAAASAATSAAASAAASAVAASPSSHVPSPSPAASPDLALESKKYEIFRKYFHVPTAWKNHDAFQQLIEHRYPVGDFSNTILFVKSTLAGPGVGYKFDSGDDELRMEHDYICHLLADMLSDKGVAFLTEKQLQQEANAALRRWLNGTPDLLVHGKKNKTTGTYIIDVYTGGKDVREVKAKYKTSLASRLCEPVVVLHPHNIADGLTGFAGGVFSSDDVKYFLHNFAVFCTEAQYWRSCLQMGRILRNDRHNVVPKEFLVHEKLALQQTRWLQRMLEWAQSDLDKLDREDDD